MNRSHFWTQGGGSVKRREDLIAHGEDRLVDRGEPNPDAAGACDPYIGRIASPVPHAQLAGAMPDQVLVLEVFRFAGVHQRPFLGSHIKGAVPVRGHMNDRLGQVLCKERYINGCLSHNLVPCCRQLSKFVQDEFCNGTPATVVAEIPDQKTQIGVFYISKRTYLLRSQVSTDP